MVSELQNLNLPPIKIVLTGEGRVGSSAKEILQRAEIQEVSIAEFLKNTFNYPVFCQLRSEDYFERKDQKAWDSTHFHQHPTEYVSKFLPFANVSDVFIAGAFWNPKAPVLFTKSDMKSKDFKIKLVADITCDINGSIPCTMRASSIPDPVYDYDKNSEQIVNSYSNPDNITVMAVDNLPCELPRDASESFARQLAQHIFYNLVVEDEDLILNQATIVKNGKLTIKYSYLSDFAS